jgi:hypothetical protein
MLKNKVKSIILRKYSSYDSKCMGGLRTIFALLKWKLVSWVAQSVQCLVTGSGLCVQTGSGAHPASCTVGTGGPFPGAKTRPERDADQELYLLSPQAPSWRVVGQLKWKLINILPKLMQATLQRTWQHLNCRRNLCADSAV